MKDKFADSASEKNYESAIDAACALKSMVVGYDVSPQDLRTRYNGAQDEAILRIIDTLHVSRYDWMENTSKSLEALCTHVPQQIRFVILDEALDIAFERLKHIGFLQTSGKYMDILEHDKISEGQDRFPELYDASREAEEQTRRAISDIAVLRHEGYHLKPTNDKKRRGGPK